MIGALGRHVKDVVNALNVTTEIFIEQKMCMVSNPGNDESEQKMKANSLSKRETKTTSFAQECLHLCTVKDRKDGVKSSAKYAKCKIAAKILEMRYYLQESQDVHLSNLKMTAVGLPKRTHLGLLARYNLQT
jgi:hypothetical protein